MKKKKHHHKHKQHRNAGSGGTGSPSRSRTSRLPKRAPAPPWKTIVAAVGGGGGGAALGGLVVNQKILSPEAVGLGLMLGGGAAAYFADGTARVVGTSVAAAGAGQLALALMTRQAVKSNEKEQRRKAIDEERQRAAFAQLPAAPAPVPPPRKSATGGGVVVDLFRDAANDLDVLEDEWRYGIRDHAGHGDGHIDDSADPIVIDLDQAA